MFFILLLLIYGPVLVGLHMGAAGDLVAITSAALIVYGALVTPVKISPAILGQSMPLLLLFAFSLSTVLVFDAAHIATDTQGLLRPVRALVTLFGMFYFVNIFKIKYQNEDWQYKLIKWIYYVLFIQAVIMLIQFQFPAFRDIMYSYTNAQNVLAYNQRFRMAGLSGAGGAQLSIFQGMAYILLPYLTRHSKKKSNVSYYVMLAAITFSILLCGRSGLVELIVFMPLSYCCINRLDRTKVIRLLFKMVLSGLLLLFIIYALSQFITTLPPTSMLRFAFMRTFSDFYAYSNTGQVHLSTIDTISKMFYLPNSAILFLFGQLQYVSGYRGVNSDIGYIRFLFGYGIIGSVIAYSFYTRGISLAKRYLKSQYPLSILVILTYSSILFFQFKEILCFSKTGLSITSLLLCILLLSSRIKNETYY
jgi:hypothetical protein